MGRKLVVALEVAKGLLVDSLTALLEQEWYPGRKRSPAALLG